MLFKTKCGKDTVEVYACIGLLSVRYRQKVYLIEYCKEEGEWYLRVGKMDAGCFARITQVMEEFIMKKAAWSWITQGKSGQNRNESFLRSCTFHQIHNIMMISISGHLIDPRSITYISNVRESRFSGFEFEVRTRGDNKIVFSVNNPAFIASLTNKIDKSARNIESDVLLAEVNNMKKFVEDSMKTIEYEPTMLY